MTELLAASALDQADAVRRGEVTAVELMDAALRAAERAQADLHPFTFIDPERALADAATISPGDPRTFAGVPFATKDLLQPAADQPLTYGSRLFGDYRPGYDSVVVARARAAGLVLMGQTISPEFGAIPVSEPQRYGPVRNPYDRARSAGGSSGGAAAVAGGVLAIAAASDAGGSIRMPAACCGVVGLKPSRGRVSLGPDLGDHPLAVQGCVSRTVADTAAFLDAVAGPSAGDPIELAAPAVPFLHSATTDGPPLRIGLCTDPQFPAECSADRIRATRSIAQLLADRGHHVEEIPENPWPGESIAPAFSTVLGLGAGAFATLGEAVSGQVAGPDTLEPLTWALVRLARSLSAADVVDAQAALHAWSVGVERRLAAFDVVLTLSLPGVPLPLGTMVGDSDDPIALMRHAARHAAFTPMANITGRPALTVPVGTDEAGLPVSVQLVGRRADESTVLALGAQVERLVGVDAVQGARP